MTHFTILRHTAFLVKLAKRAPNWHHLSNLNETIHAVEGDATSASLLDGSNRTMTEPFIVAMKSAPNTTTNSVPATKRRINFARETPPYTQLSLG